LLQRLAAEAEGLWIGTNLVLLPLHNPVELAEVGAFLDVLTNGQFILGVSLGYRPEEFAVFGLPMDSSITSGWRARRRACSARSLHQFWLRPDLRRARSDLDGSTPPYQPGVASRRPRSVRWHTPFLTAIAGSGTRRVSFAGGRIGYRTTAGSNSWPMFEGAHGSDSEALPVHGSPHRTWVHVSFRASPCFAPMLAAALFAVGMLGQSAFAQVPIQLPPSPPGAVNTKIHFDLSEFNDDGLYGPPDGLRAAMYEFCIPARADLAAEVASIDPTVQIYADSPGRIGCGSDEYLCIGSTGQPGFREVLANLAQLEFVSRIQLSVPESSVYHEASRYPTSR
jgi:Luciferase-like monooxygenase